MPDIVLAAHPHCASTVPRGEKICGAHRSCRAQGRDPILTQGPEVVLQATAYWCHEPDVARGLNLMQSLRHPCSRDEHHSCNITE